MVPTLHVGDHILVNKLSYGIRAPMVKKTLFQFGKPSRGDVVVFTLPDDPLSPEVDESDTNIIKRVIGLAGDVVEVRGMKLYINGKVQEESDYTQWLDGGRKDFGPEQVPEGRILLLGDNRDQSKDSRYWDDHYLELSRIKGRAFIIYWNTGELLRMFTIIR